MSMRIARCLVLLAVLLPFAGCTPPASEDVRFVGGSVTDGGSCCPGSTAILGGCPSSEAEDGTADVAPGTTAS